MRVEVDLNACQGNAICTSFAPEVFELGDDDLAHVLLTPVPAGLEDKARDAVRSCPQRALRAVED